MPAENPFRGEPQLPRAPSLSTFRAEAAFPLDLKNPRLIPSLDNGHLELTADFRLDPQIRDHIQRALTEGYLAIYGRNGSRAISLEVELREPGEGQTAVRLKENAVKLGHLERRVTGADVQALKEFQDQLPPRSWLTQRMGWGWVYKESQLIMERRTPDERITVTWRRDGSQTARVLERTQVPLGEKVAKVSFLQNQRYQPFTELHPEFLELFVEAMDDTTTRWDEREPLPYDVAKFREALLVSAVDVQATRELFKAMRNEYNLGGLGEVYWVKHRKKLPLT